MMRWLVRHYVSEANPLGPVRAQKIREEKVLQYFDFPSQSWKDVPTVLDKGGTGAGLVQQKQGKEGA